LNPIVGPTYRVITFYTGGNQFKLQSFSFGNLIFKESIFAVSNFTFFQNDPQPDTT
jgi:hypothetical protein